MPSSRNSKALKVALPEGFERVNLNAAGIDVGATQHYVAVPVGRDSQNVRSFGTFTEDLRALADWLQACGIETVAMESTGVYWIALFQILEERGFDVKLVNARQVKNVSGRKSDMSDCQWLQQLHTYGLLSAAFRPADDIAVLRSYLRHRDNLVRLSSVHIQHMQKALSQMNLQLDNVISDITGVTGMKIIKAILAGERDPARLANYKDGRIKSSAEVIAKSLVGDYRVEHLLSLRHAMELYEFHQQKIAECEQEILKHLHSFEAKVAVPLPENPKKRGKQKEKEELRLTLNRISGVDLTRLPGIDTLTAQVLISEIGLDMSKWRSEKAFAAWLGLAPHNETSGKMVRKKRYKVVNRAAQALRMAAFGLTRSQTALGAYYRRLASRSDAAKAITATAHKLARLVYHMLKFGEEFVEQGVSAYEAQFRERSIKSLDKRAASLGFALIPIEAALSN